MILLNYQNLLILTVMGVDVYYVGCLSVFAIIVTFARKLGVNVALFMGAKWWIAKSIVRNVVFSVRVVANVVS